MKTEKFQIKTYLFGIKLDTITYLVEEISSKQKGILNQKFIEDMSEYFTIKLKIE
jgi:hypothetical protein